MGADTCHIEQSESGDRHPGPLASTLSSVMFSGTYLKEFHVVSTGDGHFIVECSLHLSHLYISIIVSIC